MSTIYFQIFKKQDSYCLNHFKVSITVFNVIFATPSCYPFLKCSLALGAVNLVSGVLIMITGLPGVRLVNGSVSPLRASNLIGYQQTGSPGETGRPAQNDLPK